MLRSEENAIFPAFLGKRIQLAFVVKDLDAALCYWTKTLEVRPFVVIEKSMGDREAFLASGEGAG